MPSEAPKPVQAFGAPAPYEASLEDLRRRLTLPGPMAWAACLALGHKTEPEALALLAELAEGPEWSLRNLAVQGLGAHPRGAQAAELAQRELEK